MTQPAPSHVAFTNYLAKISQRKTGRQRVVFADLRSGLSCPTESLRMAVYLEKWVKGSRGWWRDAFYMIGALYTLHPVATNEGNLGDHLSKLRSNSSRALDRRVMRLLNATSETIYGELRNIVSLLSNANVPINWALLLSHLIGWNHPSRYVRKLWAKSYFGSNTPPTQEEK